MGHENGISAGNLQHFMITEGGEELEDETKKVRIGVYMEKELVDRADELLDFAGARSRNEFVAEAVKFYIGYLHSRKAGTICFRHYPLSSPVRYMTVKIVWPGWILNWQWSCPSWRM